MYLVTHLNQSLLTPKLGGRPDFLRRCEVKLPSERGRSDLGGKVTGGLIPLVHEATMSIGACGLAVAPPAGCLLPLLDRTEIQATFDIIRSYFHLYKEYTRHVTGRTVVILATTHVKSLIH